ncbi:heavy metal-binding domain-containing protein [Maribellus sediminis]|uniref:heavy metal-binding domain-containing protein n=1 Tax=Maribellus sediminis TaxID=2696285 RepID=UPI001430A685|nr:heavy metal-binding domain-containing protein [Maribellus sediminis]
MKLKVITTAIIALLLSSCFYAYYPQTGSETYSSTQVEDIEIYSGVPEQEYVVMGSIAADAIGDADDAVNQMKKTAAKLGADAVINVQFTTKSTCGGKGVSGVAVKMKPNAVAEVQYNRMKTE